jgi:hypothetical protein
MALLPKVTLGPNKTYHCSINGQEIKVVKCKSIPSNQVWLVGNTPSESSYLYNLAAGSEKELKLEKELKDEHELKLKTKTAIKRSKSEWGVV